MGAPAQAQPVAAPAAPAAAPATTAPSSNQPAQSAYADSPSLNNWDSFPVNGHPAVPETTSPEQSPAEFSGDTTTDAGAVSEPAEQTGTASDFETYLQTEAANMGLDPNDPRDRKVLKRLFDKDSHIHTLESERKTPPAATPTEAEILQRMTEFEQQLSGTQPPQTPQPQPGPAQPPQGQAVVPPAPMQEPGLTPHGQLALGDIGDSWKEPKDAYQASNEAWQEALSEGGNFDKVFAIDNSMFTRRLFGHEEVVQSMVEKFVRQRFPELLTMTHRTRMDQDRDFALGQLEKAGLSDIREMFKADAGAAPITFNGTTFENSPFNRIVSQNPWLLDLRKSHSDPRKADQLSTIGKVRVAYAMWKRGAANAKPPVAPAQVQQIMQNGVEMERRQQQDRARQGMNASGRGPVNNSTNGQPQRYVQMLQELPDEQRSIDELLR